MYSQSDFTYTCNYIMLIVFINLPRCCRRTIKMYPGHGTKPIFFLIYIFKEPVY